MGEQELKLRDLLYLDFDKTASIWSQLDLGLLERVSVTQDSGKDRSAGCRGTSPPRGYEKYFSRPAARAHHARASSTLTRAT